MPQLIACPGCGQQVWSAAPHCPHCGYQETPRVPAPVYVTVEAPKPQASTCGTITIAILLLVLMVALMAYCKTKGC